MTPGSQWPCISLATLPAASRPEADVAPSCAGVARKPLLNGSVPMKSWTTSPALTKQGSEKSRSATAWVSTSWLQLRTAA